MTPGTRLLAPLVALLAAVGRQGTRAVAAIVVVGISLPWLGAILKPYVTPAIFVLLCLSFMRLDVAALRIHLRRPGLVLAAALWSIVAIPCMAGLVGNAAGLRAIDGGLYLGLLLQTIASPMMAAPALAAIMGLDATLVLVALVASTALVPFTAPVVVALFVGDLLSLAPLALGAKLLLFLGGAVLSALVLRRLVGEAAMIRHRAPIDGFNILVLLVFVSGVMENVASRTWSNPLEVAAVTVLAFGVFAVMLGATLLVFRSAGGAVALALAVMVCQRNMGLMLAATEGHLPDSTWLYFALGQLPIYLSPLLLAPLAGRLRPDPAPGAAR